MCCVIPAYDSQARSKPNFIVILADDMGYADLGCFGVVDMRTPHLDRMAKEGMRLTNFHMAAPTCTASRAALLTGCYPVRVGMGDAIAPAPTARSRPAACCGPTRRSGSAQTKSPSPRC